MTKKLSTSPLLLEMLHPSHRALMRYYADGSIFWKHLSSKGWEKYGSVKATTTPAARVARLRSLPKAKPWMFPQEQVDFPSMEDVMEWSNDGVCESVTGDRVEPDGHGPDGAPSWLLFLGYV